MANNLDSGNQNSRQSLDSSGASATSKKGIQKAPMASVSNAYADALARDRREKQATADLRQSMTQARERELGAQTARMSEEKRVSQARFAGDGLPGTNSYRDDNGVLQAGPRPGSNLHKASDDTIDRLDAFSNHQQQPGPNSAIQGDGGAPPSPSGKNISNSVIPTSPTSSQSPSLDQVAALGKPLDAPSSSSFSSLQAGAPPAPSQVAGASPLLPNPPPSASNAPQPSISGPSQAAAPPAAAPWNPKTGHSWDANNPQNVARQQKISAAMADMVDGKIAAGVNPQTNEYVGSNPGSYPTGSGTPNAVASSGAVSPTYSPNASQNTPSAAPRKLNQTAVTPKDSPLFAGSDDDDSTSPSKSGTDGEEEEENSAATA